MQGIRFSRDGEQESFTLLITVRDLSRGIPQPFRQTTSVPGARSFIVLAPGVSAPAPQGAVSTQPGFAR